ncbi:MAG: hypothetical protein GQ525_10690 [Draconibacterium sp.]|nr:hypothetical protein [Draconibacterium sp.]
MNKTLIIIAFLFSIIVTSEACTTAVISGKYTKDGRPLLYKNRDTWAINNRIMYFNDAKYEYMGLVNSKDSLGKSLWIGMNEMGFSIMNSASYNLNIGDTTKLNGLEGRIMKHALATCATVNDFEEYLASLEKPTRLEANFGVIDANGGAILFELNNQKFVKFDANDATVAPYGYILRTNYSFTGSFGEESSGYIRQNTVDDLFYNALSTNSFDAQFIMQDVTRGLKHSLLKTDLYLKYGGIPENTDTYTFFHDFIPRQSSSSACVVQGVKKDENPEFTTLWSAVGFPLTSIVIPTWLKAKNDFPDVLKIDKELNDSPICDAALTLKKEVFPIRWGKFATKFYININSLVNADKTGIRQKIKVDEDVIFLESNMKLEKWRSDGMEQSDVIEFNKWLNDFVKKSYKNNFNLNL